MKSVLISIQPGWCELIASGEKTVEVRKTRPKIETPFKCYIYETKDKQFENIGVRGWRADGTDYTYIHNGGKVIGEFVCDKIYDIKPHFDKPDFCNQYLCDWKWGEATDCLSFTEMNDYLKGKNGYGWHISDLVIYDKPKELSEFYVLKKCNSCRDSGYESSACCYDEDCKVPAVIARPPQSWRYVEEVN